MTILIILIILAQTAFSQFIPANIDDKSMEEMMSRYKTSPGSPSASEKFYIQQMLEQERKGKTPAFQTLFPKNDSADSDTSTTFGKLLNYPQDTISFVMIIDTVSVDSLNFYEDIEELKNLTPDGKKRIVIRKKKIPKNTEGLQRYESNFFKTANPSLFSGVTSIVSRDYPLKPGDNIVLTIWGAVEKEIPLKINNQGMVNVESVGLISLNGTTLASAEGIFKVKLSKVYSGISRGQTFVNLRVENLSPVKVFILGETEKPGAYVFHGNTTVFQALYMAGGPSKDGSVRSIQIARADSIFNIDLYDYLMYGKNSNGATLFDGDIVFLPRAKILAGINGAVGRSAIYELKEGEGIAQLISFAGGINPDAAEQNMVLKRIYQDGRKDYETILKPGDYINGSNLLALQNGDSLLVFKSVEESMRNATILGAIKYPGTYKLEDNMSTVDLVNISGGLLEAGYSGRVHVLRIVPQGGYQLLSQNLNGEKPIALEPRDTLVVYSLKDMFKPDSVSIGGAVFKPGYYSYYEGMDAKDLLLLAGGYLAQSKRSSLSISRLNEDKRTVKNSTYSISKDYDENKDERIKLSPWDHVEIPYDSNFYRPELVVLHGAFRKPGVYSLNYQDETLENLINRAGGFSEEAYLDGAKFFRRSIAMNDSLELYPTLGLVGINISKTLKKEERNNISLMDGDSIYIPVKPISVKVWGEVGLTTNVLWKKGSDAKWYINQAGGLKITGDEKRVMIKYANGSVTLASEADREPDPGSEIFVPYKKPPEPIVWTQVVSAVGTIISAIGTVFLSYIAATK